MGITEYWVTLISIIVGLAVTDLLANLHNLFQKRARVDWDPLPLVWAVVVLLFIFNYWWGVATNMDGALSARVAGHFVLLAVAPVLLYLMAASVLPRDLASEGSISMRVEWERNRSAFLSFFSLLVAFAWLNVTVIRGAFVWDLAGMLRAAMLTGSLAALFLRSRRVEWPVAIFVLGVSVFTLSVQAVR
jgi:hypothetical protein